jgi:hypothetical protein
LYTHIFEYIHESANTRKYIRTYKYVYSHICMCTWIHLCICKWLISAYVYINKCAKYVNTYMNVYVYKSTYIQKNLHLSMYPYTYTNMYVYIYTYIYLNTCMMNTCVCTYVYINKHESLNMLINALVYLYRYIYLHISRLIWLTYS